MDDAERGFYLRCLDHAWLNGGLPADPVERARQLETRKDVADRRWLRVGKCFVPHEFTPTLLVNPRQESERKLALRKAQVRIESAKVRNSAAANGAHARIAVAVASDSTAAIESKTETNPTRAREPEAPPPAQERPPIQPEVGQSPVNGNGNGHSNGNLVKFGLPAIEKQTEYPETVRAVHDYFPECDLRFVHRLVAAAGHAHACVAQPLCPFSDQLTAEAVRRVYKQTQEGAGLFMRTVPECIRTWALEGLRSRASPPPVRDKTDRAMDIVKADLLRKEQRKC